MFQKIPTILSVLICLSMTACRLTYVPQTDHISRIGKRPAGQVSTGHLQLKASFVKRKRDLLIFLMEVKNKSDKPLPFDPANIHLKLPSGDKTCPVLDEEGIDYRYDKLVDGSIGRSFVYFYMGGMYEMVSRICEVYVPSFRPGDWEEYFFIFGCVELSSIPPYYFEKRKYRRHIFKACTLQPEEKCEGWVLIPMSCVGKAEAIQLRYDDAEEKLSVAFVKK